MTSPSPAADGGHGHYFTADPGSTSRPRRVALALPDSIALDLATDSGVFSAERVDAGTRLLLADGPPAREGTLLDLGCGYGPIACTLARRTGPSTTVWAVDVNRRALELCAANAVTAGVGDRVRAVEPDAVDDVTFDQIWSNPPVRIGKAALHDLLASWLPRLAPDGEAVLVVQKHLGADSLARWLNEQGWPTRRLGSRMGYRLLRSVPGESGGADDRRRPAGAP